MYRWLRLAVRLQDRDGLGCRRSPKHVRCVGETGVTFASAIYSEGDTAGLIDHRIKGADSWTERRFRTGWMVTKMSEAAFSNRLVCGT
jgi:hypothetical protein